MTVTRSGSTPSSSVSSPRENSDTVISRHARRAIAGSIRRCHATYALEYQPGWRSAAASWTTTTERG
jgi:hypothetical protein